MFDAHVIILAKAVDYPNNNTMKDFLCFERLDYEEGGWPEYISVGIGRFLTSFSNPIGRSLLRAWAEADARKQRHEAEMKEFTEASRTRYLEAMLPDDTSPPSAKH